MRTARRRWFNLIRDNKHIELPKLLLSLRAISTPTFREFLDTTHQTFRDYQLEKQRRRSSHSSSRHDVTKQRLPRSIKPTKARF